jgi:hypothetical protein
MATEAQIAANRENAKKGGRKKGEATILREKAKDYLARRLEEEIAPIADSLISKAAKGDVPAIKELFDRAWGKAPQALTGANGGALIIQFDNAICHCTSSRRK